MAGKFPELGDHELGHRGQVAVEQAQKTLRQHAQQVGGRTRVAGHCGLGRLYIGQHSLAHHSAEQILLGREVEVYGALADPRGRGNVLQLGGGIATIGERGEGGRDDFARSGFLAAGADWDRRHPTYLLTVQSVIKRFQTESGLMGKHGTILTYEPTRWRQSTMQDVNNGHTARQDVSRLDPTVVAASARYSAEMR